MCHPTLFIKLWCVSASHKIKLRLLRVWETRHFLIFSELAYPVEPLCRLAPLGLSWVSGHTLPLHISALAYPVLLYACTLACPVPLCAPCFACTIFSTWNLIPNSNCRPSPSLSSETLLSFRTKPNCHLFVKASRRTALAVSWVSWGTLHLAYICNSVLI